ncbi:hypothetical protein FQA39_LY03348 [Lamprigera yunnana]|nr:hypothetical protein FQA39_LY03348 [Lamprigera yunnana]
MERALLHFMNENDTYLICSVYDNVNRPRNDNINAHCGCMNEHLLISIERLTVQAEVLNTCKDQKIPALIVQLLDLAADLKVLDKDIKSKYYELAIPIGQLSEYYKLDIADCKVTDQRIHIYIRVPINQDTLRNALGLVEKTIVKQNYVIAITTISQYYSMPLIECVMAQDTGVVGIHVPLLKSTLKDLTMKRVVTPIFAWEEYTCSVNIPSFTVVLVEKNDRWFIVLPKCDPFKEDLCLVTNAYNAETLALLCIRQVLIGGSTWQFSLVCPISCRETGRQNQFISFVGSHRASITHPKDGLTIRCQKEQYNLNNNSNLRALIIDVPCHCQFEDGNRTDEYPTFPCVDKTIKFGLQTVLPAIWTKTPGLTLPS